MDVIHTFLHDDLSEKVYMTLQQGYHPKQGESWPPNTVCKLHKFLSSQKIPHLRAAMRVLQYIKSTLSRLKASSKGFSRC